MSVALALAGDAFFETESGSQRVLDLIGPYFVILYFCDEPAKAAARLETALGPEKGLPLKVCLVHRQTANGQLKESRFQLLADPDGRFYSVYAAQPGTLYLLRPDGHIAARGFDFPLDRLPEVLGLASGHAGKTENLTKKGHS